MAKLTYANIYTQGLEDQAAADSFAGGLTALRESSDPLLCPHRIAGSEIQEGTPFEHRDPCDLNRVISGGWSADRALLDRATGAARAGFEQWRQVGWQERVDRIQSYTGQLRENYDHLTALLGLECGKTRADAVAEVEECVVIIDLFCKQMRDGKGFEIDHIAPSDDSRAVVTLDPYGVFGVIGPFNFPLAIPMAMAAAALITGNAVVMKPSAMAPACGDALARMFERIGLPEGVFNCVQGGGESGAALAQAEIDGLVFTGSAEVGLDLAQHLTQPPYTRPVISEMGGKNPAIVTGAAADLTVAAKAVARSAFGMSGQKCNACSRAVVTADVYDEFTEKLVEATKEIKVGDPLDSSVFAGPVIAPKSIERYRAAIATAERDGRVLTGGKVIEGDGCFAEPTVVDGLPHAHDLTREELFLPILSLVKVDDFDAALTEANAVRYGLSAGIFTADEGESSRFLSEIEAGIVFVNNPGGATTGVWPGSQTMSGWKASGSSGKGGFGPWYLQQFAREKSRTIFN